MKAAFLRNPQNAFLMGLVLVADGDDVSFFVFAAFMDCFASPVGAQA